MAKIAFVKMVIMDKLTSNFIEREGLRLFMNVVRPNLKFVFRIIVVKDYFGIYTSGKRRLKDVFVKCGQKVCSVRICGLP